MSRPDQEVQRDIALRLVSVLLFVVIWWWLATRLGSLVLPSPPEVISAAGRLGPQLLVHASATACRVLTGLAIGAFSGVLVALAMSYSRLTEVALDPIVELLRPLPPIALTPLFILWFGLGPLGQIALIAIGCFMVLCVSTLQAVRHVPPVYIHAARALGATTSRLYLRVLLPAIAPSLVGALRVGAALAFGLALAAELMGAQSGIGFLVMTSRRTLETDVIVLSIIVVGIESALVDAGIRLGGRWMCRWSESTIDALALTLK